MKKSILFLVLLQSLLIFAQAPQKMTYQSVVRNSANVLLANQAVGVRISILEGTPAAAVYSETHTVTTNANGLFTLEAGGGTPTEGVFADIVWGNGAHYIKSEIDPAGGTNYSLSATKELLSVPYALYAANGITTAQADAITDQTLSIAAQTDAITALQAQITSLIPIPTVLVGTQTWQTKNLNVTTYRNGEVIPEVQDATAWESLTTGAWCHYDNDPANDAIYGKLYNWYAVNDSRGLAPSGFHVPTDTELTAVTDMKDPAGFAGLPGGTRFSYGEFYSIGDYGNWWGSNVLIYSEIETYPSFRFLSYEYGNADTSYDFKQVGNSVRCVKDEDSAVNPMQAQIDAQTLSIAAQADAITAQAVTITAFQAQIDAQASTIAAMQAQITSLIPTTPTEVVIGTQTWQTKNLNVTTYSNGDVIPEVQDASAWESLTTGAWCHYDNDPANDAIYGKLYNWYAVNDSRGLAPSGFHVPTDTELTAVTDMKDPAGFAGLPGGTRDYDGTFDYVGNYGFWWSSSEYGTAGARFGYLDYASGVVVIGGDDKRNGFSVRCLRD